MGLGGTLFLPGLDRSPMYVGYWSPGALSALVGPVVGAGEAREAGDTRVVWVLGGVVF